MPESEVHSFIVKLWLDDTEHRKGTDGGMATSPTFLVVNVAI